MLPGSASVHLFSWGFICCLLLLFFFIALPEKLLSKQSRACPEESTSEGAPDSTHLSPAPADPGTVAELRNRIEELTSQNSELALKVQVNSGKISYKHT